MYVHVPPWEWNKAKFFHFQLPTASSQEGGDRGGQREGGGVGRGRQGTDEVIIERDASEECSSLCNSQRSGKKSR